MTALRLSVPPAFRHADFRRFGLGYSISSMGSQFTDLAMAWQMYEITSSPLQVGLIAFARFIPQTSLVLFGGVLADAVDRRCLLIATQIGQFFVSSLLVLATVTDTVSPTVLYGGAVALALFTALDNPARTSVVPNLVPPSALASGMALMNLSTKAGAVLGPAFAGITIVVGGPALCYAADALSWLALLVVLLTLRTSTQTGPRASVISLRSIGPGLRFVRAQPVLVSIFLLDFGAQLLGTNRGLLPVYARDILAVGAPGLGLLFAASSFGAILAGTVVGVRPPTRHMGGLALAGAAIFAASSALFAVSREFWFSLVMMAVSGAGNALSVIVRGTISQLDTPDGLRGRVASISSLFTGAGPRLGQTQSGLLAEVVSVPVAALAGALGALALVGVIGAVSPLRSYEPRRGEDASGAATRAAGV